VAAFPLSPSARLPIRGIQLSVRDIGDGPTIAFSHGLLWSKEMFAPQMENLATEYRCVAWDHRGQGESEVPEGRSVPIEDCYEDAVALIEGLDCGPVHFIGLSMGGFVGLRIAARRPDLVRSLVLIESAADPEPAQNIPKYRRLNWVARWLGVPRFLARQILPIMLGQDILNDPDRAEERDALMARLMTHRRHIYKAVNGVIEREGVQHELERIDVPTLILHGEQDQAIQMERAMATAARIATATMVTIPQAGHTSTLENPEFVTQQIRAFLSSVQFNEEA